MSAAYVGSWALVMHQRGSEAAIGLPAPLTARATQPGALRERDAARPVGDRVRQLIRDADGFGPEGRRHRVPRHAPLDWQLAAPSRWPSKETALIEGCVMLAVPHGAVSTARVHA